MKTAELTGALLDYWVARVEPKGGGMRWEQQDRNWIGFGTIGSSPEFACWIVTDATSLHDLAALSAAHPSARFYSPSTNWAQGGPIIEHEMIELIHDRDWREDGEFGRVWQGHDAGSGYWDGDTALIAAMRAYVASKFGDEVSDDDSATRAAAQGENNADQA